MRQVSLQLLKSWIEFSIRIREEQLDVARWHTQLLQNVFAAHRLRISGVNAAIHLISIVNGNASQSILDVAQRRMIAYSHRGIQDVWRCNPADLLRMSSSMTASVEPRCRSLLRQ